MLKNLEAIKGSTEISKNNQKTINGGLIPTGSGPQCFYFNSGYNNDGAECSTPLGANGRGRCLTGICSPNCH